MPKIKTVLGFDFGVKYIGIAVGYTMPALAQPLTSVQAMIGEPNWQEIISLVALWSPDALIVGIPLNMDGTEQWVSRAARRFADHLTQRFNLPVFRVDERLTTVEARARLFAMGGHKALRKRAVDSVAAQLIIETWLDSYL